MKNKLFLLLTGCTESHRELSVASNLMLVVVGGLDYCKL